MRKAINRERIEGWVYDHELALKTVQNTNSENFGKEFINGTLDVQTDDDGLNVVTVHFTYVTEMTKKGTKNDTYTALKNIIDSENKTVVSGGKDNALMVRIDTALGVNDFYTNRNGEEILVSAKRNDGGFVHIVNKLNDISTRNTFEVDFLINGTRLVEADEERHIDKDYLIVKGAVFNFRNALLPVEFVVKNEGGIKHFESLEASQNNPVFKKVWGKIECQTIIDRREEESAFGEAAVKEYTKTVREWVITGASPEAYELDENSITIDEIQKAVADRNVYLADVKKRQDEYQASKAAAGNTTSAPAANAAAKDGGFNW